MCVFTGVSFQHGTQGTIRRVVRTIYTQTLQMAETLYCSRIRPNATILTRPQLMEMPSLARFPVAKVRFNRSEPARSTKWNLAVSVSKSVNISVVSRSFPSSDICGEKSKIHRRIMNNQMPPSEMNMGDKL